MPSAGQAPSHSLTHSFSKYFIMRIFSAKQRSAPASSSGTLAGEGRRAENFQVFRPGVFPASSLQRSNETKTCPRRNPRPPGLPRGCFSTPPPEGALQRRALGPPLRRAPLGSALRAAPRRYVPPSRPPPPRRPSPPVVGAGSAAILGCSALAAAAAAAAAGRGGSPGTRPQQRGGGGGCGGAGSS